MQRQLIIGGEMMWMKRQLVTEGEMEEEAACRRRCGRMEEEVMWITTILIHCHAVLLVNREVDQLRYYIHLY